MERSTDIKPPENKPQKQWFIAVVPSAHVGRGREETHRLYVWAESAVKVLDKLRIMGGWKKDSQFFPAINPASEEQISELDQLINDTGLSPGQAKTKGVYGRRR